MRTPKGETERNEFVDDWNKMVAGVARFSDKWDMPKGELVFPPEMLSVMRSVSEVHLLDTFIAMGVRTHFGRFEQMTVLRQG
jgi:hypothetical protein